MFMSQSRQCTVHNRRFHNRMDPDLQQTKVHEKDQIALQCYRVKCMPMVVGNDMQVSSSCVIEGNF